MITNQPTNRRFVWLFVATFVFLTIACLESPPQLPCEENIIRENPVIQELNSEFTLLEVSCFVNGELEFSLNYEVPTSYSAYEITYHDYLSVVYSKDKTIKIADNINAPRAFETKAILEYFKQRIEKFESNPRIREFILKTEPGINQSVVILGDQSEIIRPGNRIQYNYSSGLVQSYSLSNSIDWQEFPEIKQAHKMIEENIQGGDQAHCHIGRLETYSYTYAEFEDLADDRWNLTVPLECDDGWKAASIQISNKK